MTERIRDRDEATATRRGFLIGLLGGLAGIAGLRVVARSRAASIGARAGPPSGRRLAGPIDNIFTPRRPRNKLKPGENHG